MLLSFVIQLHSFNEPIECSAYSTRIAHDQRKFISINFWIFTLEIEKAPPTIVTFIPKFERFPYRKFTKAEKEYFGGYRLVYFRWLALEFGLEFIF